MIKVSTTGMAVSLKTDLRFPESGQQGHGTRIIHPQIQILISFWNQKTEKQKFDIKENVMSELVKMPVRHFLRSDYLHIFFYIKFLLFVSLVQ